MRCKKRRSKCVQLMKRVANAMVWGLEGRQHFSLIGCCHVPSYMTVKGGVEIVETVVCDV